MDADTKEALEKLYAVARNFDETGQLSMFYRDYRFVAKRPGEVHLRIGERRFVAKSAVMAVTLMTLDDDVYLLPV